MIKNVVQEAIESGYLSIQSEKYLYHLFYLGCDLEDLDALSKLQEAVTTGTVKRLAEEFAEFSGDRNSN